MLTIPEVAALLSLTEHQVRRRLDQFRAVLAEHIRRGPKNAILLTADGLGILRRALELEHEGLRLSEIEQRLNEELTERKRPSETDETAQNIVPPLWSQFLAEKDRRIADLQAEIARLEAEVEWLRAQVRPQLPARRRWWAWWRRG